MGFEYGFGEINSIIHNQYVSKTQIPIIPLDLRSSWIAKSTTQREHLRSTDNVIQLC